MCGILIIIVKKSNLFCVLLFNTFLCSFSFIFIFILLFSNVLFFVLIYYLLLKIINLK